MARARRHPVFARLYTLLAPSAEAAGAATHRDELLEGLAGRVVEVGAGPGMNFAHYPASVERVFAVEPESYLARRASAAAGDAALGIAVVRGEAEHLPIADDSVDAVVLALVLCSVRSPDAALAEAARVLRAGGELRFYEHVRSSETATARLQDRIDPLWTRVAGGCHCNRDTVALLGESVFAVEHIRYFDFPGRAAFRAVSPHVLGVARASRNDKGPPAQR